MPDIVADPERITEFARQLHTYAQETRDGLQRTAAVLQQLGSDAWRDAKHREFVEQFERDVQGPIGVAVDQIENEQVPYLHGLADRLREYLSR